MTQHKSPPRPLDVSTVISLEHAIAAPVCLRQLADLGARVIKIERPGVGDCDHAYDTRTNGLSSHYSWTSRSKESPTLDVKKYKEESFVRDWGEGKADVLVQNLAPGAAPGMGLSFEALPERFLQLTIAQPPQPCCLEVRLENAPDHTPGQ